MLSCHQLWEVNYPSQPKPAPTEGSAKTLHQLLAILPLAGDLLLLSAALSAQPLLRRNHEVPWLQSCLLSLLVQGLSRSQSLPPQRCNQRSKTWLSHAAAALCHPAAPLHPPVLQGTGTRRAEGS